MPAHITFTSNSTKVAAYWRNLSRKYADALDATVHQIALDAEDQYHRVTRTWQHQPQFVIGQIRRGQYTVTTDDPVFHYLEKGTRVRRALMSRDWVSKTKPRVVGSFAGRGRVLFISRKLNRPGIQARGWSKIIHDRLQPGAANRLRRTLAALAAGEAPGV